LFLLILPECLGFGKVFELDECYHTLTPKKRLLTQVSSAGNKEGGDRRKQTEKLVLQGPKALWTSSKYYMLSRERLSPWGHGPHSSVNGKDDTVQKHKKCED
ncbi:hypothetical protein STEG23_006299, partial [Scotinomys teguina]